MKKYLFILACATFALGACGKKSSSSGAAAAATTYYKSDNVCYDSSTNKQVDISNCSSVTYYLEYGGCYKTADGSSVAMSNCMQTVGAYFYGNGSCVSKSNYQYVSNNLCLSSTSQYGYDSQSNCIDTTTKQIVPMVNCANASGRYQWSTSNTNICLDTFTGYQVSPSLCPQTSSGGGYICRGTFAQVDSYGRLVGYVDCSRVNCSGQTLYDGAAGVWVDCK